MTRMTTPGSGRRARRASIRVAPAFVLALAALAALAAHAPRAHAQLEVWPDPIVQERAFQVPVWMPPFECDTTKWAGPTQRLEEIVYRDLDFTGLFRMVRATPTAIGMDQTDYSVEVRGRVYDEAGTMIFEGRIVDVTSGDYIGGQRYRVDESTLRRVAHHFADEVVRLTTGETGVASTKIVYVRRDGDTWNLTLADYDGYRPMILVRQKMPLLNPRFADRNQAVIYTTYRNGKPDLYIRYLREARSRPLARYPGNNDAAEWSDRTRMILAALSRDGNPEIYLLEPSGAVRRRLTHSRAIDTAPSWAPGGREFVFVSDRSGSPQLYVMERDGTNLRRITWRGGYNATPAWSPRGDRIAFVTRMGNEFQIATITPDGRDGRLVTRNSHSHEDPRWAPDGRHVVHTEYAAGRPLISVVDIRTGGTRILAEGANPDWSRP